MVWVSVEPTKSGKHVHVDLVQAVLLPAAVTLTGAAAGPHVDVRVGFAGQRDRHVPVHRDDRRRDPGEGVRDPAAEGSVCVCVCVCSVIVHAWRNE